MRVAVEVVERAAARHQGVVTRGELVALGAADDWIARQVVLGRWQRLHPGVLVPWSGPVPWPTRGWGALLAAGEGATLSHASAAYLHGMVAREPAVIDVTVPHGRRVRFADDARVRVHRRRRMPATGGRPRRTRRADTVLDLAAVALSVDEVVGWVTAAARAGMNTHELSEAIARRGAFRSSALLLEIADDVEDGVESPLERRYRRDVERRHGLPRARLQAPERLGTQGLRADGRYDGYGVRVELDGWLGHPGGRTDADTWRDNAVAVAHGEVTLRYRWRHVAAHPCATADQVAQALRRGGWHGQTRRCGPGCVVDGRAER